MAGVNLTELLPPRQLLLGRELSEEETLRRISAALEKQHTFNLEVIRKIETLET